MVARWQFSRGSAGAGVQPREKRTEAVPRETKCPQTHFTIAFHVKREIPSCAPESARDHRNRHRGASSFCSTWNGTEPKHLKLFGARHPSRCSTWNEAGACVCHAHVPRGTELVGSVTHTS